MSASVCVSVLSLSRKSSVPAKPFIVVTSISPPNKVLREIAAGSASNGFDFIVIGDTKSPSDCQLDECDFPSVARQQAIAFSFARLCPTQHYARKNIGYLLAMAAGAPLILETDDDNIPHSEFWLERAAQCRVATLCDAGWVKFTAIFPMCLSGRAAFRLMRSTILSSITKLWRKLRFNVRFNRAWRIRIRMSTPFTG
jgi:hypothetical protein